MNFLAPSRLTNRRLEIYHMHYSFSEIWYLQYAFFIMKDQIYGRELAYAHSTFGNIRSNHGDGVIYVNWYHYRNLITNTNHDARIMSRDEVRKHSVFGRGVGPIAGRDRR